MRRAVLLLALLVPAPALAQAPPRNGPPRVERPVLTLQIARPSASAMAAARRYLCPNGGVPQGRGRCAPGARGAAAWGDSEVRGWDLGIAPPNRAQSPCPPGTITAAARDNPGVTRCIAG